MAVVDPATRTVECRIPTQPGTRTVAVDAARGLIVSGSMLTGEVLVQAPDGHVVRHFGPAMPMMRDVALDEEVGHAWLGTWTALYRFDYAGGMVPGVDALGPCQ
jgi:hypothetical protein